MILNDTVERVFKGYFKDELIKNIDIKSRLYEGDKRYYAFVEGSSGIMVILKFYRNEYNDGSKAEGYAELSKAYRDAGIIVPKFYLYKSGKYHTYIDIEGEEFLTWCEEALQYSTISEAEEELTVSCEILYKLGEMVGTMHDAAKRSEISFSWNSALVMFDTFYEGEEYDENYENAKELYETLKTYDIDKELLESIWTIYNGKRQWLKERFVKLPQGGVQGDLSPSNIMIDKEGMPVAIIDFNQSGRDVFINDMMQWAIYLSFECFKVDEEEEAFELMKSYIKGYGENYYISEEEQSCMGTLYNVIRPFRYERVSEILEKAENSRGEEVKSLLKLTLEQLQRSDSMYKSLMDLQIEKGLKECKNGSL